ncbi:glycosyltransferase [Shinella kummerowiae]|uniref:Glycosyltransferase n=1 Tax=Shinella kummerowiae TaxID=417745 RepID=A0A6N8SFC9_9HYPH|nr:glycosyltransferase family 4 protein [Shinella kummerowiae]MXN46298.1 glycosyltransferase [Shinella kummerowiae]
MARVLLIAPTCNGEDVGEAWVAFQWARRLAERHDVTLLTYHKRGARPAAEQLPAMRVIEWCEPPLLGRAERLNSLMKPAYLPFYLHARRWIRQALARGERFDLVHQPVPVAMRYPSPAAGFALPLLIGPVGGSLPSPEGFTTDDTSSPWFTRLRALDRHRLTWDPWLRASFRNADCVLGIADYVKEILAGVPLKDFQVMSETGLDALPERIDRSGRQGPVRLLFVGRLVRTKGVRDLIRALPLVSDLPVELDIVGEGPERAPCEALVASLGLEARVRMHGWQSKEKVGAFYRAADIFTFPSYREPGGNVALEAMGYSLPLIVVDRGGPGSATSDLCAMKLSVSTPEKLASDLAAAIATLAADAGLRDRMGRAAYDHVGKTALWSAKLDRVDTIYADLAGQR